MDSFDLAVILAAVLGVVLILLAYLKGKSGDEQESGGERQVRAVPQERPPGAVAAGVPRRAAARNARARMRIGAQRRQEDRDDDEDAGWGGGGAVGGPGGSSSEDEGAELEDLVAMPDGKVGAKKRKKLEMKAEKRANREAELAEREERKEREDRKRQEQEKRDEKQRAVEKQKEDEEKARKEEEARREQEEYERLKAEFAVEEEGFDENDNPEEAESLLQKFVDFIKEKKIVRLEVIAAEFKLRIQDVINRIEELLKDGSLTGVLDDRGKFIWVTEEELLAVAKFIKQRGRVSIAELAENSNALIKFPEDVKA